MVISGSENQARLLRYHCTALLAPWVYSFRNLRLIWIIIHRRKSNAVVLGIAMSQNKPWLNVPLRMSTLFMPKYEVTKDKGKKITVTVVKMVMALLLDSLRTSIMDLNCVGEYGVSPVHLS